MDLALIRRDLGECADSVGFNAFDYPPDDPISLPAAIVGGIKYMERLNRIITQIQLGVILYASTASAEDAARTLDTALSIGTDGSYVDAVEAMTDASWRSVRFVQSDGYLRYSMPGGSVALGVEIILELTG